MRFYFGIPNAVKENVTGCLNHPNLAPEYVYAGLTQQYLAAIELYEEHSGQVGKLFKRPSRSIKASLICGCLFFLLVLFARSSFKTHVPRSFQSY
jgi:hypothetical protein